MKLSRFLINFIKALTVFVSYGTGTYLVFELLKTCAVSFIPYLIWILLGLLVICICALAASHACYVEGKK
jgi:tryptophan-rich sensory protein